jgi:hypothetical protein
MESWDDLLRSESNTLCLAFFSVVSLIVKQWGIERYKEFLITSSAVPKVATGFDWYSWGIIFRPGRSARLRKLNASEDLSLIARKQRRNTALSCAKTGLIDGLDAPLTRRYRFRHYVWPHHPYVRI